MKEPIEAPSWLQIIVNALAIAAPPIGWHMSVIYSGPDLLIIFLLLHLFFMPISARKHKFPQSLDLAIHNILTLWFLGILGQKLYPLIFQSTT